MRNLNSNTNNPIHTRVGQHCDGWEGVVDLLLAHLLEVLDLPEEVGQLSRCLLFV